jgi:single-strand DNA-binding protein
MNVVTMTATLTRDPVLKQYGEKTVCEMRVAERKPGGDPLFITATAFGTEAEKCATYLRKGRHVAIAGRLRFREWEAAGGGTRSEHSIAAGSVEFLSGGQDTEADVTEVEEVLSTLAGE